MRLLEFLFPEQNSAHHFVIDDFLALIFPSRVCLQEVFREVKLLCDSISDALKGEGVEIFGFVACNYGVA